MNAPILEAAAQEIAGATSKSPFLYELGVERARKVLDDIQAAPIGKLDDAEKWISVPVGVGEVKVRIVKPRAAAGAVLPAILYMHGGGWILGNAGTHDRLVRELAVGADAAAGVPTTSVRYNGTIHDFMMLNPVPASRAASAAVEQAIHILRGALGTGGAGTNANSP